MPVDYQEDVHASLAHSHLPKLADEGLIEYDSRSGDIRCTDGPLFLEEALILAFKIENLE